MEAGEGSKGTETWMKGEDLREQIGVECLRDIEWTQIRILYSKLDQEPLERLKNDLTSGVHLSNYTD